MTYAADPRGNRDDIPEDDPYEAAKRFDRECNNLTDELKKQDGDSSARY
jgi:hypothetical protein